MTKGINLEEKISSVYGEQKLLNHSHSLESCLFLSPYSLPSPLHHHSIFFYLLEKKRKPLSPFVLLLRESLMYEPSSCASWKHWVSDSGQSY